MKFSHPLLLASVLLLLCAGLFACGGESAPESSSSAATPEQLFSSQQCAMCHGPQGQGMPGMGPDLRSIDEHWTVDSLVDYLGDPKGYAEKDERLAAGLGKYRMPMPLSNLPAERRRVLAEYVLGLE